MKKVTIECDEQTARLISKALDVYCRMGLGQFWYLTDVNTVQKNLWAEPFKPELQEEFRKQAEKLSNIYTGGIGNAGHGIFSPKVGDDCKITCHIHQQIRHEFYLQQPPENRRFSGVDASPADICQIANMPVPNFKIKIEDEETLGTELADKSK